MRGPRMASAPNMVVLTLLSGLLLVARHASSSLLHTINVKGVSEMQVVLRSLNMTPKSMLSDIHKRQIFHLMHQPELYASKTDSEWDRNLPHLHGLGVFTVDKEGHDDELIGTLLVSQTIHAQNVED